MPAPYLPIVYVRGYAATQGAVNDTVDDPFYGFNLGSTHIRVGAKGEPERFFFESPLVRLSTDYGYTDAYNGRSQDISELKISDKWKTIWIYRYYDPTADTFNWKPERLKIEDAAEQLRTFIEKVKEATGAPQVHLVAHSMGGLISRSLLEKIYPEAEEDPNEHVARFFTYATPHGGIQLRTGLGWAEWLRDLWGPFDSDTFGPDRMYQFLTPNARKKRPADFDPRDASDVFNPDNVFCAVGTNADDYNAAKKAVGPQSDGLVQIDAAYVFGAHRAYVHRSHSGRYGIVNSEEAFQNLERFLFGDIQAVVTLEGVKQLAGPNLKSYQLDQKVSVRGLPVFMNERTRAHFCPIILNQPDRTARRPFELFTQFLNSERSTAADKSCCFAISFGLYEFGVVNGRVDYSGAVLGLPNWFDTLRIDLKLEVGVEATLQAWWTAANPDTPVDTGLKKVTKEGWKGWEARIPLPQGIATTLLGENAHLRIEAYDWSS